MSEQISHHIPDALMASYAAGSLSHAFSLVVATHISMCDDCRAALAAHEAVGGTVLDAMDEAKVSSDLRSRVMDRLDENSEADAPAILPNGIYPGPINVALQGLGPRWKRVGGGVRQCILNADSEGSVRLLHIPAGRPVPEHSHGGLELTLVLQGAFSDETGHFGVGDVEVADGNLEHVPTADPGADCICLAATDAPLRFNAFVPRLLQPFLAI